MKDSSLKMLDFGEEQGNRVIAGKRTENQRNVAVFLFLFFFKLGDTREWCMLKEIVQ